MSTEGDKKVNLELLLKAIEFSEKQTSLEEQSKIDGLWNQVIDEYENHYLSLLTRLTAKQRWDFGFDLLTKVDNVLPFGILDGIIADIPNVHNGEFDDDLIEILLKHALIAKYEYGFTINEIGAFAELLIQNKELSVSQSLEVIKFMINIWNYNFPKTLASFNQWIANIDDAIAKVSS